MEKLQDQVFELENCINFVELLADNLPGLIYRCKNDKEWTMDYLSKGCFELTGYQPEELISNNKLSYSDLICPEDRKFIWDHVQEALKKNAPFQFEYRINTKSGEEKWVWERGFAVTSERNEKILNGFIMDITDKKEMNKLYLESDRRLQNVINTSPCVIYTTNCDKNFSCEFVSDNIRSILGFNASRMINEPSFWFSRLHPDDVKSINIGIKKALATGSGSIEYRLLNSNDEYIWIHDMHNVLYDEKGSPVKITGTWTNVSNVHKLSETISYNETHDLLTGVLNRFGFEQELKKFLIRLRKTKSYGALCLLDVDQLIIINNACGLGAGDGLLKQIGNVLKKNTRETDILSRTGGDEFGLILENCSLEKAETAVRSLFDKIQKSGFKWEKTEFDINMSAGIVPVTDASTNAADVMRKADLACHTAREEGSDGIRVYHEIDAAMDKVYDELNWAGRIGSAVDNNLFCLYLQPIVPTLNSKNGKNHFEVLVRMKDKGGAIIPPGVFLPPAEKYGFSARIDLWVFNTLVKILKSNPAFLDKIDTCSINLSGHSITNRNVFNTIHACFEDKVIPASKICFELTETAIIGDMIVAIEFMTSLRKMGCRFSLDDFGTGLSSFSYLKILPVDYIKIDGSFIKNVTDNDIDYEIIASINNIGHVMGKQTIGEYVENGIILSKLKEIGVDYAQGYGIGKPMPVEEVISQCV